MNRRSILSLILAAGTFASACAAVNFSGCRYVTVTPAASTGLESVFVAENCEGSKLTFAASSPSAASAVRWSRFDAMGAAYATPVTDGEVQGNESSISLGAGDSGYLIEAEGRQTAVWVVDYARHEPTITAFSVNPDSDCDRVVFDATGGFDRITYYSINGAPSVLNRGITVEYSDLSLPADATASDASWEVVTETSTFNDITGPFSVPAPLCNTVFTLKGDAFAEAWGIGVTLMTDTYTARRVEAKTWASQGERNNDNEQNSVAGGSGLGGSAPATVLFTALPSDAVIWGEWQFSATDDFADVINRFTDYAFDYTFTEAGTTYVRFVCADASGDCQYESETYAVSIGESKLLCPNAFSPHNEDGINDEWKVSYASLISFDCHIFNRWGKELFHTTNPATGWDGRVGGKFVPSGVYFYVIKAEGADGVKYNLSGDINIIGSKLKPTYSTEE